MTHKGRCFCGQVHYSIDAEPLLAGTCWCRDCQYIACGSGTNNVFFPEAAVQIDGSVGRIEKVAASGNRIERGFCPNCGTHVYSRTLEPAGVPIRIRAGTLDNPDLMAPGVIIWTASAPSWATFDPDLPKFPQAPPQPMQPAN